MKSICFSALLLAVAFGSTVDATDYCNDPDLCKPGTTHIVCGHDGVRETLKFYVINDVY